MPSEYTISRWVEIVQAEYIESPGLHLTKPQVRRLWGLDPGTCDVLLDELESVKFLRRTDRDSYVRSDVER